MTPERLADIRNALDGWADRGRALDFSTGLWFEQRLRLLLAEVDRLTAGLVEALDYAMGNLALLQPPGHPGDNANVYGEKHLINLLAGLLGIPHPFPYDEHGTLTLTDAHGAPLVAEGRQG